MVEFPALELFGTVGEGEETDEVVEEDAGGAVVGAEVVGWYGGGGGDEGVGGREFGLVEMEAFGGAEGTDVEG